MPTSDAYSTISPAKTFLDSILAKAPGPSRSGECNVNPALPEDSQHDAGLVDTTEPNVQDGHHPSPAPPQTTSENGDPITAQELLQEDQQLTEDVRFLLQLGISGNAITVKYYRWVLMDLRDKLRKLSPREVPHRAAYVRILLQLLERLVSCVPSVCPAFQKPLHLHRQSYADCLGMLLTDMAKGFIAMQQTGKEDDVYILNEELHSEYLYYLISHLEGV